MDLDDVPEPDLTLEPEGYVVDVDGTRIHFLDWGGPPVGGHGVLLIHGLGQTAWTWAPVARRLARETRVVAMDLRGHGLSDAPRRYDLALLAEDAIAVIEGTDLDGGDAAGVVFAGHGFGGIVAAWTAGALEAEGAGRAAGLVLVDGGWEDVAEASGMEPHEWLPGLDEPPEVMRSMGAYLADRRDFDPATWDATRSAQRAPRPSRCLPAMSCRRRDRTRSPHRCARCSTTGRRRSCLRSGPIVALVSDDPDGVRTAELERIAAGEERPAARRSPSAPSPAPATTSCATGPGRSRRGFLGVARTIAR